jgi:hypothetical protein
MVHTKYIRQVIIHTLLCVYVFALLKPVMPLVNDIIAHTFYKMQHLATVHYENGKYHLHAELADESEGQKKEQKGNIPVTAFETLANHYSYQMADALYLPHILAFDFPPNRIERLTDAHVKNPCPPPWAQV